MWYTELRFHQLNARVKVEYWLGFKELHEQQLQEFVIIVLQVSFIH